MRALGPAALFAVLMAAAFIALPVLAGTTESPEIKDPKGDGTRTTRDITEVWFDGETNSTINATMNLTSLESYTSIGDLSNLPTVEYEVYFSVGDKNYSVACTAPVHGPTTLRIAFDLRSVTYGNDTNNPVETRISTFTGSYSTSSNTIRYPFPKSGIGDPKAGTHLTKTWAAIWAKNFGQSNRSLEDRGPNSGYGLDYIVRGAAGAEIIDVRLSVDNSTLTVKPNEPASFSLKVANNGTSQVTLELFNSSPRNAGWTVYLQLENLTLLNGSSRVVTVTISCPRDAKLNSSETISVYAVVHAGKQNSTSGSVYLTAVVNYIPPKVDTGGNPLTAFVNWMKGHPKDFAIYLGVIVAVIVALTATGMLVRRINRKKRAMQAEAQPQPVQSKAL